MGAFKTHPIDVITESRGMTPAEFKEYLQTLHRNDLEWLHKYAKVLEIGVTGEKKRRENRPRNQTY